MKLIAFDESGNTGADLLNQQQRVFVLASSDLTLLEAEDLLSAAQTSQATEVKFSKLKRSVRGKQRIIRFIQRAQAFKDRIKTSIIHKEYMITGKFVDLVIEPLFHKNEIDLYKDGGNIGMANMLFFCMPAFCGEQRTINMYKAFIQMVRSFKDESVKGFINAILALHNGCSDDRFRQILSLIVSNVKIINEVIEENDRNTIDPAIPSFFTHCTFWGDHLGKNFEILHDDSNVLWQEKRTLELFMSKEGPYKEIGYDRRKYGFPLKANGLCFGKSETDPRLQVVDIIASSSQYWANRIASDETEDCFWDELNNVNLLQFHPHLLWPSVGVTPQELKTDSGYGSNPLDYMVGFLLKQNGKQTPKH